MSDCLFCKIAAKELGTEIVFENEKVLAFNDIAPQAPIHILIIPKVHVSSVLEIDQENSAYLNAMFEAARHIAREKGLAEKGFRLVINTGDDGGQTVNHLHLHLLGGRHMEWPPG